MVTHTEHYSIEASVYGWDMYTHIHCTSWSRHLFERDMTLHNFVALWEVPGRTHCVSNVFHPYKGSHVYTHM